MTCTKEKPPQFSTTHASKHVAISVVLRGPLDTKQRNKYVENIQKLKAILSGTSGVNLLEGEEKAYL